MVTWGAIAIGAWRFLLGLFQVLRGAFSSQPAAGVQSAPASSASSSVGIVAPTAALSGPALPSVIVVGVLLIVQAVVRLGFLINLLLRIQASYFDYMWFVIQSLVVPAILVVAGMIAAILALGRFPAARGFGLTFCALGLIYQLYGLGSIVYLMLTKPTFQVSLLTWGLIAANIVVYVAGLIVFGLSAYYRQSRPVAGTA